MSTAEKRSLIAFPIILLIGIGLAFAGSQGSLEYDGFPVFAICLVFAFVVQWMVFIPAYLNQTEKFFDLTGSLTYMSVGLIALWLGGARDTRSLIIAALVIIWAGRLGTFLFQRIQKDGHDGRFDVLKPSFIRFLNVWTIQGLWVSFTFAAGLAAITSADKVAFGVWGIIGLIIWILGFGFEVVADRQKKAFRADPANKGKFISSGLWAWSRHPNYFGEIMLWLGIAIIAFPVMSGWQYVTLISPIFVYILLSRVSGVPLLEARSDEKWGGQEDYEAYKAATPVLFPKPPS